MAWRPNKQLIEGELDNTKSGRVTGWMTFVGLSEPVTFHLEGDFHRDIRGAAIRFKNPHPVEFSDEYVRHMEGFATHQQGVVGDITAGLLPSDYTDYPYIEFYSDHNGRVVIELEPDDVEILGEPLRWETEEPVSREKQAGNMNAFLAALTRGLCADQD